jgi:hypothetical protein
MIKKLSCGDDITLKALFLRETLIISKINVDKRKA